MLANRPRWHFFPALFALAVSLPLCSAPALAMDFGMGVIGGFNYVPSPGDFINQHSLLNAGRTGRSPTMFTPTTRTPS